MRRGYGWRVPAGGEARIGVGSYDPHQHVRAPTDALAARVDAPAVRYQGNWFPHRLRTATDGEVLYVGDSAGHCFPLSGEGIRTAFYFGIAAGRELRAVLAGRQDPRARLRRLRRLPRRPRAGLPARAAPAAPRARAAAADAHPPAQGAERAAAGRSRLRLVPRAGPPALRAGRPPLATDDLEAHGPRGRAVAGRVGGAHEQAVGARLQGAALHPPAEGQAARARLRAPRQAGQELGALGGRTSTVTVAASERR